jgi:hypothetical protein
LQGFLGQHTTPETGLFIFDVMLNKKAKAGNIPVAVADIFSANFVGKNKAATS